MKSLKELLKKFVIRMHVGIPKGNPEGNLEEISERNPGRLSIRIVAAILGEILRRRP